MNEARSPGDLLLHPVALLALGLVILNDRVLKSNFPGLITGKLSDFTGLIYFPLFVVAFVEAGRWIVRRRPWELRPRSVEAVALVVGVAFVLIKTCGPAAEVYRSTLGYALWPAYAIGDAIQGHRLPGVRRFDVAEDPTDLVALIALVIPMTIAHRVAHPVLPS